MMNTLIEKGFTEETRNGYRSYRKDGLFVRHQENSQYCVFKVNSDHMVVSLRNVPFESFSKFQENVFERVKSLLDPVETLVRSSWGKHVQGETLLTWLLFNGATHTTPYDYLGIPQMLMELQITPETGRLSITFDMAGRNNGIIHIIIEKDDDYIGLTYPIHEKRFFPKTLESHLKKSLREEFQKCSDSLNGIL